MEIKAIDSVVADVTDRDVTGFASVLGVIDSYQDIVHPGSFAKTLKENGKRVRHLWMHDVMAPPIATVVDMHEVGTADLPKELLDRYPEATGALLVKRRYLETPRAEEILQGIKAGAITEMSFGYDTIKSDYSEVKLGDDRLKVRNLREVRLWDVSDVTFGANPATMNLKSGSGRRLLDSLSLLLSTTEALTAAELAEAIGELREGKLLPTEPDKLAGLLDALRATLVPAEPPVDVEAPSEAPASPPTSALSALTEKRVALIQRALSY